jgi:hypothetical protein
LESGRLILLQNKTGERGLACSPVFGLLAGGMSAPAGDFNFVRARVLAGIAAVLLAMRNGALTGFVRTLLLMLFGHTGSPCNSKMME